MGCPSRVISHARNNHNTPPLANSHHQPPNSITTTNSNNQPTPQHHQSHKLILMILAADLAYTSLHPWRIHKRRFFRRRPSELHRTALAATNTSSKKLDLLMSADATETATVGSGRPYPSPPPEEAAAAVAAAAAAVAAAAVAAAVAAAAEHPAPVRRRKAATVSSGSEPRPSAQPRTQSTPFRTPVRRKDERRTHSYNDGADDDDEGDAGSFQFHSYLTLALSHPPPPPMPDQVPEVEGAPNVYGPPPHDHRDDAAIAMERILNFLLLPPKLEGAMMFGVLACLDSWLYIFTILPLRFVNAAGVLLGFWRGRVWDYFNYEGRKLKKKGVETTKKRRKESSRVSGLGPSHKADLLRGMVLFTSCWFLMRFDASKMYHSIRGQSGIKLYVIYNMLDVSGSPVGVFRRQR